MGELLRPFTREVVGLGGFVMDISTGLGLLAGAGVLATLILLGGDLRMFADMHAAIVIFGGSFAATLIRFPLASIFHGLPLGAKFAFTLRSEERRVGKECRSRWS